MWKFQDFSVTQILREINFGELRSAKSAILTHLEGQNFDFNDFLHFLNSEMGQINKIQPLKWQKRKFWNLSILQN